MRTKSISALTLCLVVLSALPFVSGEKNKKDYNARLRALQTVYVDGSSLAVSYIRKNLPLETCLTNADEKSEAEAILEVWEESPVDCGPGTQSLSGAPSLNCSHIYAKLLDPKTKETLWFREDQHSPLVNSTWYMQGESQPPLGDSPMNGPYRWVLWTLKSSCCKGR